MPNSAASSSVGNPKSLKRLHHEIMKLSNEAGKAEQDSMGVHVTPAGDGDNLYKWDIRISKWDDSTSLGRSCKKNGVDEVLLSMIVPEEYPLKPPFVRVVWPELQGGYVFGGGAICFELLTDAGWLTTNFIQILSQQQSKTR
jgi:ubiquitin-conjugating enzyme E2 Q